MRGRSARLADALAAIRWIEGRHAPFNKHDVARDFGWSLRTTSRWIAAMEGAGLIELVASPGGAKPWLYQSGLRCLCHPGPPASQSPATAAA